MNTIAVGGTISVLVLGGLLATILRLTWRASREKTAKQQRNSAEAVAVVQRRANQAQTDACNTDTQLEESLKNDSF